MRNTTGYKFFILFYDRWSELKFLLCNDFVPSGVGRRFQLRNRGRVFVDLISNYGQAHVQMLILSPNIYHVVPRWSGNDNKRSSETY